jgi:dephospho-CoA kinase
MYSGKPIIGLSGGIGAGKTFVGSLFAEFGCMVISSDALVRQVYLDSQLKSLLHDWWRDAVFDGDGEINRAAIGKMIFDCEGDRLRLEHVLHPRVARLREEKMAAGAADGDVIAFVWDTPLLFETQLCAACDVTVFVDAPEAIRLSRVRETRGWDTAELARREISQLPLDKKRAISDYIVVNTTNAESTRVQVRELLSRILAGVSPGGSHGRC